jgi:hypothetical protein
MCVGKVKRGTPMASGDVYVARSMPGLMGSVLGNPFVIGKHGDRASVIAQYRVWLWAKMQEHGAEYDELVAIANRVKAGEQLTLLCWCAPQPCHAEIIIAAVRWLIAQD